MKLSFRLFLALFTVCLALPALAQNTVLVLDSDPGDYIGGGDNYYYTPGDGAFNISKNYGNGVTVTFVNGSDNWTLDFAAPDNALLKVKDYVNAGRFPFREMGQPGLEVYGDGRGCNTLTGEFQVLEIVYGTGDAITSFHATFVQHCEGGGPALTGEVLYNSSAPLPPKNHLTSALTMYGTNGQPFDYTIRASNDPTSFTATNLPAGLTLNANTGEISGTPTVEGTFAVPLSATGTGGVASGTLTLTIDPPGQSTGAYTALYLQSDAGDFVGQGATYYFKESDGTFATYQDGPDAVALAFATPTYSESWDVSLSAPTETALGVAPYFGATRSASSANPGISVTGDSRGCNTDSGSFVVKEYTTTGSSVASLHATFEQHCEDAVPALEGEVWFHSTRAITSLPFATANRDESFSYQIVGNNAPTSYTAAPLPPGLSFSTTTGVISGTPTVGGFFSIPVTATGPTTTAGTKLNITILPPDGDMAPVISSARKASVTINEPFHYQVDATHSPDTYTANGLPAGLVLDATSGVISGAATVTGTFNIILTASNGSGTGGSSLTLSVDPPIPVLTNAKQATTSAGKPFTFQITATNQPTTYSSSGLPEGLILNSASGLITGTPTTKGTYIVTLRAVNGSGVGFQNFTLTVILDKPKITSPLTATAIEGQAFEYQITADGTPTSYAATGLPDGLTLNAYNGIISGTTTGAGTFNVTISATNAGGTGSATLVLTLTARSGQLLNISTRLKVGIGEDVLIGGFIVTGQAPKPVLIRGLGPSLATQGVSPALEDPVLELHDSTGNVIATNDNWKDTQKDTIIATTIPPTDDLESAIVATLPAGNATYTAVLRGKGITPAVGLLELYDLSAAGDSLLANISTRGVAAPGDDAIIGGFIIGGGSADGTVLVRGLGPSLTDLGIQNVLPDPSLELHNGDGDVIASNDDWQDMQQAQIEATGIPPTKPREAAIVATLPPGNYTAVLRGKDQSSGVALVEIYNLPGK